MFAYRADASMHASHAAYQSNVERWIADVTADTIGDFGAAPVFMRQGDLIRSIGLATQPTTAPPACQVLDYSENWHLRERFGHEVYLPYRNSYGGRIAWDLVTRTCLERWPYDGMPPSAISHEGVGFPEMRSYERGVWAVWSGVERSVVDPHVDHDIWKLVPDSFDLDVVVAQ